MENLLPWNLDYKSGSLPLQELHAIQQNDSSTDFGPHFVYGSVTDTQKTPSDNSDRAVIVHVVDDSGKFPNCFFFLRLKLKFLNWFE